MASEGILDGAGHRHLGREVIDHGSAAYGRAGQVEDVARQQLDRLRNVPGIPGGKIIHDPHAMSSREERLHQMGADEAGSPGDDVKLGIERFGIHDGSEEPK